MESGPLRVLIMAVLICAPTVCYKTPSRASAQANQPLGDTQTTAAFHSNAYTLKIEQSDVTAMQSDVTVVIGRPQNSEDHASEHKNDSSAPSPLSGNDVSSEGNEDGPMMETRVDSRIPEDTTGTSGDTAETSEGSSKASKVSKESSASSTSLLEGSFKAANRQQQSGALTLELRHLGSGRVILRQPVAPGQRRVIIPCGWIQHAGRFSIRLLTTQMSNVSQAAGRSDMEESGDVPEEVKDSGEPREVVKGLVENRRAVKRAARIRLVAEGSATTSLKGQRLGKDPAGFHKSVTVTSEKNANSSRDELPDDLPQGAPTVTVVAESTPLVARWPPMFVGLPQSAESHEDDVMGHVRFTSALCAPHGTRTFAVDARLVYSLSAANVSAESRAPLSPATELHRQRLRHFYERGHDVRFSCGQLERAAQYQLQLVSDVSDAPLVASSGLMQVRWSRHFTLKVRGEAGGSVFPCLAGVEAYFGRPRCAGPGDRLRLFGVERSAVASATPPVTEHYIAERPVTTAGALTFPCSLFSERFIRYCVHYVTFGPSGAVYLAGRACLPSLPAALATDGGFGPWSAWSPCAATCGVTSQARYRLCDSPQPRNNGIYCQGDTVEWRTCHLASCPITSTAASPVARAHVSTTCRCGCDVLLSRGQNYSLAASSRRCPGQSLWRFESSDNSLLRLQFSHFLLNLSGEALRARDGVFSNSELLLDARGQLVPPPVTSSGPTLHLFYIAGRNQTDGTGGFVAAVLAVSGNRSGSAPLVAPASQRPGLSAGALLSLLFLSAVLSVLGAAVAYHGWKIRLNARAARSASRESLVSGGGGARAISRATSCTSVAESAKVVLRLRPPRRRRKASSPGSERAALLAHWQRFSRASGGSSLPTSPVYEQVALQPVSHHSQPQLKPPAAPSEEPEKRRRRARPRSKTDKERENRRRLRVRADSEDTLKPARSESALGSVSALGSLTALSSASTAALSSAPEQELELDYYDYHIGNARLAPGSIFGMDPLQLSLCAYDYDDVTPTEEMEMDELGGRPKSEVTEFTEVTGEVTDAETEVPDGETLATDTDVTEVVDDIQFADDTDDEVSIEEDKE